MKVENKPVYYDGSGQLPLVMMNHMVIVVKPETKADFKRIPYFPYQ